MKKRDKKNRIQNRTTKDTTNYQAGRLGGQETGNAKQQQENLEL